MEITVDEWLAHYLCDPAKRETLVHFLEKVLKKCDRFATMRGEGLDQKLWKVAKESANWGPDGRKLVRWFIANFRQNGKKFHALEESDAKPLPSELQKETPRKDLYVVRAAMATERIILTTDNKLKEKLSHRRDLAIHTVDEFMDKYGCQNG